MGREGGGGLPGAPANPGSPAGLQGPGRHARRAPGRGPELAVPEQGQQGHPPSPELLYRTLPTVRFHFTDKTTKAKGRQGVRQARPSGPGCWGS